MNTRFVKTKILATIGPATDSKKKLLGLIDAGVNALRLNFSHGDEEYFNNLFHDLSIEYFVIRIEFRFVHHKAII